MFVIAAMQQSYCVDCTVFIKQNHVMKIEWCKYYCDDAEYASM